MARNPLDQRRDDQSVDAARARRCTASGHRLRRSADLDRSLDELVPSTNFYRHLEATLDLRFVRDLVRGTYTECGRPSIDPQVFFKLQLVLFFEGIRSERELVRIATDRLSVR